LFVTYLGYGLGRLYPPGLPLKNKGNRDTYFTSETSWMNSDFSRHSRAYTNFFDELDRLTIQELFPERPVSNNILDDISQRAFNFPYFLRKNIMSEFKWNIVKYLDKTKAGVDHESLTTSEQRIIIKTTIRVLRIYSAYLKSHYYDLIDENYK
jgi:hypothetical protein